jgi:hypothetical protein
MSNDIGVWSESDRAIEERMRKELAGFTPIKMREVGFYEIAALLRRLDHVRAMLSRAEWRVIG